MTDQPTLARPAADVPFFYVQVCAERDAAADDVSIYAKKINAVSFELVHVEPPHEEEECELCVFVVYVNEIPTFRAMFDGDMLHDMFTLPHLVNAPYIDVDDTD